MNVVLFRRASKVEEIIIPEGTEMTTRMWEEHEDGADRSYSVVEWVPSPTPDVDQEDDNSNDAFGFELPKYFGQDLDGRDITLRVKKDSLHVHIVEATKIKTDKYQVRRLLRRFDMTDPDADRSTEIDLEMDQRARLMELFSFLETFDGRESVIGFCEKLIEAQRKD